MARGKASAGGPPAPPSALDLACKALEDIKARLTSIVRVGGGQATTGLLVAAVDDCAEAVVVATDTAEIRMVNGAAVRLLGWSTRELQTLTIWDITHTSSQMDFDVLWREFLRARRQRGNYAVRNRAGEAVEVAYCAEAHVLPGLHVSVLRKLTTS